MQLCRGINAVFAHFRQQDFAREPRGLRAVRVLFDARRVHRNPPDALFRAVQHEFGRTRAGIANANARAVREPLHFRFELDVGGIPFLLARQAVGVRPEDALVRLRAHFRQRTAPCRAVLAFPQRVQHLRVHHARRLTAQLRIHRAANPGVALTAGRLIVPIVPDDNRHAVALGILRDTVRPLRALVVIAIRVRRTRFAHHDRNPPVKEGFLDVLEHAVDFRAILLRVERRLRILQAEGLRVIRMHRHDDVCRRFAIHRRQGNRRRARRGAGRRVARNHQAALGVAALGVLADGVHKHLVEVVDGSVARRVAAPLIVRTLRARLVHALENHMLVKVGEGVRNLPPHCRQLLADFLRVRREIRLVNPRFVVHIEDDEQIRLARPLDHFMDVLEEVLADGVRPIVRGIAVPSHGNADGVKARFLHAHHQFRGDFRVPPRLLLRGHIRGIAAGCVQRIAQIPPETHHLNDFRRCFACQHG